MNNLINLLKNKTVLVVVGLSLLILIIVIALSPKESATPSSSPTPNYDVDRAELIDLSQEKRQQAMIYVESIETKLPLYLESYPTSVGLNTSINIYRLKDDPAEVVRLEIYGLSYLNRDTDPVKNPNITAFKESYLKAIEMLEGQNIDPKRLIFIYGDKEYVRTTSQLWVDALKLSP